MYDKPHLSFDEQVNLLQKRGLVVNDFTQAQMVLASTNYYRFTGYAIPFMDHREKFKAGVVFEDVVKAMRFDAQLRDLLAMALESIEIDFRTFFAYEHSRCNGPMGYKNPNCFVDLAQHQKLLEKVDEAMARSRDEKCVLHLTRKYGEIPVWAMVEVVSFGTLARMYKNLLKPDKNNIARRYMMKHRILEVYLHHLSVVRNMCAHHARLWDKTFICFNPLKKWLKRKLPCTETRPLFYTLLIAYHLTRHIPAACFDRVAWKHEVLALLKNFTTLPNCEPLKLMGIPANGFDDVWWE
ncbi:MAG: Abi family protein [Kiritimatiellaeota bacterium]|nr:Abi family protein [Kiritimatiellota bacterium]